MSRPWPFLFVLFGPIASAEAEPCTVRTHPTVESTASTELGAPFDAAREEARARMDAFDASILERGNRAMRSICIGCEADAAGAGAAAARPTAVTKRAAKRVHARTATALDPFAPTGD